MKSSFFFVPSAWHEEDTLEDDLGCHQSETHSSVPSILHARWIPLCKLNWTTCGPDKVLVLIWLGLNATWHWETERPRNFFNSSITSINNCTTIKISCIYNPPLASTSVLSSHGFSFLFYSFSFMHDKKYSFRNNRKLMLFLYTVAEGVNTAWFNPGCIRSSTLALGQRGSSFGEVGL